jgi:menaquinone-dependent protoporphyrinogen oxidase
MSTVQSIQVRDRILVAFATRYGSTEQVADEIGATFREHGIDVHVRKASEVGELRHYRAVVLGAPFYMGEWHADALAFLEKHQPALVQMPVAIFALGPINEDDDIASAQEQFENVLEKCPWLIPDASAMFGGKYDPSRLSFTHKLLAMLPASPLHGLGATDLRDWPVIRTWAHSVAEQLEIEALAERA